MIKIIDDKKTCRRSLYFLGSRVLSWYRVRLAMDKINNRLENLDRAMTQLMNERTNRLGAMGIPRALQEVQIKFLDQFDAFCNSQSLTYWLDFGTLLGAIRNSKFIPWDDDVDVTMLRHDFDIILKQCDDNRVLPDGYYFKYYPEIGLIKMHNKDLPECIGMDIFVADAVGRAMNIQEKLDMSKNINEDSTHNQLKDASQRLHYFVKKVNELGIDFVDNLSSARTIVYGFDFRHRTHPSIFLDKNDIFPLETVIFEGKNYPCPKNTSVHLTLLYGDYLSPDWTKLPHNVASDISIEDMLRINNFAKE